MDEIIRRPAPTDAVLGLSADSLTDGQLDALIGVCEDMAASDGLPAGFRRWYEELRRALVAVEQRRFHRQQEAFDAARVPADWATAVRTLPPEQEAAGPDDQDPIS